ncbi:MAG: PIN domain-containing protein [archaeon]
MQVNNLVLDTSVLMTQGKESHRDVFEELQKLRGSYTALVPSFVIDELDGLATVKPGQKRGEVQRAARTALAILDEYAVHTEVGKTTGDSPIYKVEIIKSVKGAKTVDVALVEFAQKFNAEICTVDKGLKASAESLGLHVLYLGQYPKKTRHCE